MKAKFEIRQSACIGALLFMAAGAAGACDLQHNGGGIGPWWANCNLTVDPKAPKLEATVINDTVRMRHFKLPDLIIRRYRYTTFGNSVEITATVRNIGDQTSVATTIGVTVNTVDTSTSTGTTQPIAPRAVPSLLPGAEARILIATISVNNSAADVDVTPVGHVDQLTAAQPVRGPNFESNENNNALTDTCRVFGPTPNPAVPACL
jgi:subtilase family serine protease